MEKAYYEKMKKADQDYLKKRYQKVKKNLNSNKKSFASNKYSKQMSKAKLVRNIEWSLDREKTVQMLVETEFCSLSGRKLIFKIGHKDSPSIDRINSKKGYSSRNIQIVSTAVNQAKNDLTDKEFIKLCCDVADYHRSKIRR